GTMGNESVQEFMSLEQNAKEKTQRSCVLERPHLAGCRGSAPKEPNPRTHLTLPDRDFPERLAASVPVKLASLQRRTHEKLYVKSRFRVCAIFGAKRTCVY